MINYKQLCAELVAAWDDLPWQYDWKGNLTGLDGYPPDDSAIERARAALTEPDLKTPTDKELSELYRKSYYECENRQGDAAQVFALRAVLARWGE